MEAIKHGLMILIVFYVLLALSTTIMVKAHIAEFDDVWQKRAEEARKAAHKAYNPHPEKVVNHMNKRVHKGTVGKNSTRRGLRRYTGPCMATNTIDQCWRCDPNWAKNRMKLVDCVLGFGKNVTGGKGGEIYVVNSSSDGDLVNPVPGTLRHAVIQPVPLWIIFSKNMEIRLNGELIMTSNKTIDGRGAQVYLRNGAGLTLQFIQNVIIHNLHIQDIKSGGGGMIRDSVGHYGLRTKSDGDGISIFGSSNVWIDHISMSNCEDGLIDAIQGSTAITISNVHMTKHNDVMLFGGSDSNDVDKIQQITVAFNHFGNGLVQRMPRIRFGFVHTINNDYTHWLMYAIGGSKGPTILSQGNRYNAPKNNAAKEVTKRECTPEAVWKNWVWKSDGDLMQNGAFFVDSGNSNNAFPTGPELIKPKPGSAVAELTRFAGHLDCHEGRPC